MTPCRSTCSTSSHCSSVIVANERGPQDAGVRDRGVQPAPLAEHPVDEAVDGFGAADVDLDDDAVTADVVDRGQCGVGVVGSPE